MLRRLAALPKAPFVVTDGVFAHPKFRGSRLPSEVTEETYVHQRILVHNARSLNPRPSLDAWGFALVDSPIRLDFDNEESVATLFYAHCEELVRTATGCLAAKAAQHEFRDGGMGPNRRGAYAGTAHVDVTPFIEDMLTVPEGHHFGLFNVWRNIDFEREIDFMPLAVCDCRTVAPADIVYADRYRMTEPATRTIDCRLVYGGDQRWFYFPRMKSSEALILKQYDSRREEGNLRGAFHAAVTDPTSRPDAPRRLTIETRVLAVFAEKDPDRAGRRAKYQAQVPKHYRNGTPSPWRQEKMVDWRYD